MARFLTTIPVNIGFVNLGNVQAYPTGGTGPTAYGPTTYFGSHPRPASGGDSINNAINLGSFTETFREIPIKGTHGGVSRKVSTFYSLELHQERSIQINQTYSETALTKKTNRNTLVSFYRTDRDGFRQELVVNNQGYVIDPASIDTDDVNLKYEDYPVQQLKRGKYLCCITNDFRYLETEFAITLRTFNIDWRFVNEAAEEYLDIGQVTGDVDAALDLGIV